MIDVILHGDCINKMKELSDNSVTLIVCDPPYNLQLNNDLIRPNDGTIFDGVDDSWDTFSSVISYENFTKEWLTEARRILHPDGTIMIMGMYHNIFHIGVILQAMEFWILNDIIYQKTNPTPNFTGKRLCNSHETIIWASKSKKSKYFFNYHFMKYINHGKQMRSDWLFSICSGKERILDENGKKAHSTQKPLSLMQRLVLMASKVDDVVLDPMCGTGTTLVAAKMYNRKYIGIDNDIKSVKVSQKRLQDVLIDKDLLKTELDVQTSSKPVRVSFETIIADGKIAVGTQMRFHKTPQKPLEEFATITQNGNVIYNNEELSIHKSACKILNRATANGWTYWYYDDPIAGYTCINNLREDYK